jgi:hypothetical protein
MASPALAARDVLNATDSVANISLAGATTVYTHSFPIDTGEYTAASYKLTSTIGVVNATIQLEQSFKLPDTEGSSEANYTIPVGLADIATVNTTNSTWFQKSISPIALPYARFKITGGTDNNATTIVHIKVNQETFR